MPKRPEDPRLSEKPFAMMPLWLTRSPGLSHPQFRILAVLMAVLGGRGSQWHHISYRKIAELAATDANTVSTAVNLFVDYHWLERQGGKNWRQYRLQKDAIIDTAYAVYEDEYNHTDQEAS